MDNMYSGDTLLVDLDSGLTEEVEPVEIEEAGPGLAAGLALYEKHAGGDPLIIGSGLFTGTTVPSSCLGFALGKSPVTGELSVLPLIQFAGSEAKLSGFSFVVIKGVSAQPVYLWLHDGVADLHPAAELAGKDTWETTDFIRREMGEALIQVLSIGPAGERKSKLAALSTNYWGATDPGGLGALAGEKNLKAIALRGLGMLDAEDPQAFYESSVALVGRMPKMTGLSEVCGKAGAPDVAAWLEPMVHRYRSCFACTSACGTFVKYNESASAMELDGVDEPGFMIFDPAAAIVLKEAGWEAEAAVRALEALAREGVDLLRGARLLAESKLTDVSAINNAVSSLEGEAPGGWPTEDPLDTGMFGSWPPPLAPGPAWSEATMLGYILGVCPISIMTGDVDPAEFLDLARAAADLDISAADVEGMVRPGL